VAFCEGQLAEACVSEVALIFACWHTSHVT
jgi:hypothetical protein